MKIRTEDGSEDRGAVRPLNGLARRLVFAGLALAFSPSAGGVELLGQQAGADSSSAATRLSAGLRTALPSIVPGQRVPVIVQFSSPDPQPADLRSPEAVALLQRRSAVALSPLSLLAPAGDPDIEVVERLWIVPAAVAEASVDGIQRLASSPGVERIWLDEPLAVVLPPEGSLFAAPAYTSQAMRTIGADAVWPGGLTGAGTTVAIFDSGVDGNNAMVASRWRGLGTPLRAAWFDPFRGASEPQDLVGHGTQVAVAAIGALPAGDTLRLSDGSTLVAASGKDVVTGPAPEAEWIAARVFDRLAGGDYTRRSVILQAFQWALDPDANPATDDAPDVINGSWGFAPGAVEIDACNDLIYDAVDAAEAAGIAVLFAAGNFGPAPGSVSSPAARDDPGLRSFGVGATAGVEPAIQVADYSGRGPSPCGGGIKPDVVAPGSVPELIASTANSARLTGRAVQGTSFSVAQASGVIALLRQQRPNDSPQDLKQILMQTAVDLGIPGPDNEAGYGLIDVPAAASGPGASYAGPMLQVAGAQLAGDRIAIRIRNRATEAWPGGSISVEPASRGSGDSTVEGVIPAIEGSSSLVVELLAELDADAGGVAITLRDISGAVVLSSSMLLEPPDLYGGFVLEAGDLRAGANDFGRLGRVAATPGFEWQGLEMLTAGGLAVSGSGRVSNGWYVTTLGRFDQKNQPPAIDTDWSSQRALTSVEQAGASVVFDDFEALVPLQLEVRSEFEATDRNGVGALTITGWISNRSSSTISDLAPAMLADWDLAGGESLRWSPTLSALIAESRSGEGPIAVLAGSAGSLEAADIPLGLPGTNGFYEEESGVLWDVFTEPMKLGLIRTGTGSGIPGTEASTDRAAMIAFAPASVPAGGRVAVRFWLLAAQDEASAAARLLELRAEPIDPPDGGGGSFAVDPPYPNPLKVGEEIMRFPVTVPTGSIGSGSSLVLEVFDLAGRRLYLESRNLAAAGADPVLTWDGLLDDGRPAAAGVYMYVVTLDGVRRTGRLMLVH